MGESVAVGWVAIALNVVLIAGGIAALARGYLQEKRSIRDEGRQERANDANLFDVVNDATLALLQPLTEENKRLTETITRIEAEYTAEINRLREVCRDCDQGILDLREQNAKMTKQLARFRKALEDTDTGPLKK